MVENSIRRGTTTRSRQPAFHTRTPGTSISDTVVFHYRLYCSVVARSNAMNQKAVVYLTKYANLIFSKGFCVHIEKPVV